MSSRSFFCLCNVRACSRALCLFTLFAAFLPGAALAASYRSTNPAANDWITTDGWAGSTGQTGAQDQPAAGVNVYLDSGTTATHLDLGTAPLNGLNALAGLRVTEDGWGLTGSNTLTANQTTVDAPGGTFTVTGGATLKNLNNTSIIAGTLKLADATLIGGTSNIIVDATSTGAAVLDISGSTTGRSVLTGNNLTVRNGGSYIDDDKSSVALDGAAHFNENTTIRSDDFTAGSLTVSAGKTLTLDNGAGVTSTGNSTLAGNIALGAATLNGANMTFNGGYSDVAGSRVSLTGTAGFSDTTAPYDILGDFSSSGMTLGRDVKVDASGAASFHLNGGDLTLQPGSGNPLSGPANGITTLDAAGKNLDLGNLNMGNNAEINTRDITASGNVNLAYLLPSSGVNTNSLNARNLTVGGTYNDSAGSAVNLRSVTFNGGRGYAPDDFNYINGTFTAAGMTLGSEAKVYATQPATVLNLGGDLVLRSGVSVAGVVNNTVLDASNQYLTGLNSLTMGDHSILGARDITTTGNVDLSAGLGRNTLLAHDLSVGGTYKDGQGSAVNLHAVTFNGGRGYAPGDVNNINGAFTATDMILGSEAKVYAAQPATVLNLGGDLVLKSGVSVAGIVSDTVLDAGNQDLTGLTSLSMGDYSKLVARDIRTSGNVDLGNSGGLPPVVNANSLNARNLTVNGIYRDAANSTVTLDGIATFNGVTNPVTGVSDTHSINGGFVANGMTIGADAAVNIENTAGPVLRGALELKSGANVSGSGPNNGVTTLNAPGKDLTGLASLSMGDYSKLVARDIRTSGNVDLRNSGGTPPGVTVNTLDARNLTVDGIYKDAAHSVVTLDGIATFNGAINSVTGLPDAHDINGSFSARGMTVGNGRAGALVDVADYSRLNLNNGQLTLRAHSALRGNGDFNLGRSPVDIDLNRNPGVPAVSATGKITLQNNPLTLRHSGISPAEASWVLAQAGGGFDNGVGGIGSFASPVIATASLQGTLVQETDRILFQGSYTPLTGSGTAFASSLRPNARRSASGFADLYDNRRTPFMHAMDAAYANQAALQADLSANLQAMTAEGALNHALHTQRMHDSVAVSALAHAFGNEAPLSAQGFVPSIQSSFQEAGVLNSLSRTPRQASAMAARPEFAGNGDLLISRQPGMPQGYSVLAGWQPASKRNAGLVASANPVLGADASGSGVSTPGVKAFGGYIGDFSTQEANGGYSGYSAEHHGFLLGAAVNINEIWSVGAYGGWTNGNNKSSGIKSDIDSGAAHLGLFGRYRDPRGLTVTGDLAYSVINNDVKRHVPLSFGSQEMSASYGQQVIGFGLEAAYEWLPESDPATSVTPFLSMRYNHLHQDDYREKGNLALKVGEVDSDALSTTLGVRAARDFNLNETVVLTPRANAAWLHNWGDEDTSARSSFVGSPISFETRSGKQDRDAAQLGAGLDLRVKQNNWDFGVKTAYGVELRGAGRDHTLYGGLEVKF